MHILPSPPASPIDPQDVLSLAPWFHNLHLPGGIQTNPGHPLGDFPGVKWKLIEAHIPKQLDGLTVLDIGCNAGFYSFELAARGARVTAVDIDPHYLAQAQWAARQYELDECIEFRQASVYELLQKNETYDIVWFLGVLYHLRHPLLALDMLRMMTRTMLVIQTMTMPGRAEFIPPDNIGLDDRDMMLRKGWPQMSFVEHRLADDPTNWWAPNHSCVKAMLRSAGFNVIAHPAHEFYVCEPNLAEANYAREQRENELHDAMGTTAR